MNIDIEIIGMENSKLAFCDLKGKYISPDDNA